MPDEPVSIADHRTSLGGSALLDWYGESVRPFLVRIEPDRVPGLDDDCDSLKRSLETPATELTVCLLGAAGVGKSTLVNVLVAGSETIVPAGGIGPLTALAISVKYAATMRFEVDYHPGRLLWQTTFGLQQTLAAQERTTAAAPANVEFPDETPEEIRAVLKAVATGTDESSAKRRDEMTRQARLMITGKQDGDADLRYLIDGLLLAQNKPAVSESAITPDDRLRINQIRSVLARSDRRIKVTDANPEYADILKAHASGFLSPLIREMTVYSPSALLAQGVGFVDLPGVGISGDVYQNVTEDYITNDARVVALVVEPRGVTAANADLLRSSRFLNRLMYAADDPAADPATLLVVVVKSDTIADERWNQDATRPRAKKRADHFAEVCRESEDHVRRQLTTELQSFASLDADLAASQAGVVDRLIQGLQVHAVSAIEFRRGLLADADDPPFLRHPDDSHIPRLSRCLAELAAAHADRHRLRIERRIDDFAELVESTLRLIQARWQEQSHAYEEAERLKEEFDTFLEPLRREYDSRQGAFREFLRETLPANIEHLVGRAREVAGKDIRKYLGGLGDAHWKTLQAAVRKGGTFHGQREIDLPRDFAILFEEPVADIWGKDILKLLRTRTQEFAGDCVSLVEQIVAWAEERETRVPGDLIRAQRDSIRADARKLETVGKEKVDDLRADIKNQLVKKIEKPIRDRCMKFVESERDRGSGVRVRILDLFRDIADASIEAASGPARNVLTTRFRTVEAEILDVLARHRDPLTEARDAIVESESMRLKRSDAQKRRKVLADAAAVRNARPTFASTESVP